MTKRKRDFLSVLKKEDIKKEVIMAFEELDQKYFFDKLFESYYYSNEPIPIGYGEKGDPSIILAKMISCLAPDKSVRALEIGTGSGFSTAILSKLFNEIITVEFYENLALAAKDKLLNMGIGNVRFLTGDITALDTLPGIFDRIIIFAACTDRPLFLIPYLKKGGVMVFPMGPAYQQQITILKNEPAENGGLYKMFYYDLCNFNPLIGMA